MIEDNYNKVIFILNKKQWKTTIQIANELDTITPNILPILLYGRGKIISFGPPNLWKICKKVTGQDIQTFNEEIKLGAKIDDDVLEKYYQRHGTRTGRSKKKRGHNTSIQHGCQAPLKIDTLSIPKKTV